MWNVYSRRQSIKVEIIFIKHLKEMSPLHMPFLPSALTVCLSSSFLAHLSLPVFLTFNLGLITKPAPPSPPMYLWFSPSMPGIIEWISLSYHPPETGPQWGIGHGWERGPFWAVRQKEQEKWPAVFRLLWVDSQGWKTVEQVLKFPQGKKVGSKILIPSFCFQNSNLNTFRHARI